MSQPDKAQGKALDADWPKAEMLAKDCNFAGAEGIYKVLIGLKCCQDLLE